MKRLKSLQTCRKNWRLLSFRSLSEDAGIDIQVSTTLFKLSEEEKAKANADEAKANELLQTSENIIKGFEKDGAQNITVKRDQFITPNAAEGLKTFGIYNLDVDGADKTVEYAIFLFKAENVRQQILLIWRDR